MHALPLILVTDEVSFPIAQRILWARNIGFFLCVVFFIRFFMFTLGVIAAFAPLTKRGAVFVHTMVEPDPWAVVQVDVMHAAGIGSNAALVVCF